MKKRISALLLAALLVATLIPAVSFAADPVVMIGETSYATLNDALSAANGMSGNVTVEIYDAVVYDGSSPDLSGGYDSINFVGKDSDAEISITRNGPNGYISGGVNDCAVTFTDLILSKPAGYFANDAGFMNVYFTVYRVGSVAYTNCVFPDGACAQGCPVTYTDCQFANQTPGEYSLWVYANTETTVANGQFTGVRGVKMYGEDANKSGNLVMENSVFTSSVTEKPAIVLTYGESVELTGNTYPAKGTFELDLGGDPNGTKVTTTDEITCVNDDGACGVLAGGKIYTTVAQAVAAAQAGDTVTLLHESTETVALDDDIYLDKNGFTAAGVTGAEPPAPAAPVYGGPVMNWVKCSAAENGVVKSGPLAASEGATITLYPKASAGYVLDTVEVLDAAGNPVALDGMKFQVPLGGVTVNATFKLAE